MKFVWSDFLLIFWPLNLFFCFRLFFLQVHRIFPLAFVANSGLFSSEESFPPGVWKFIFWVRVYLFPSWHLLIFDYFTVSFFLHFNVERWFFFFQFSSCHFFVVKTVWLATFVPTCHQGTKYIHFWQKMAEKYHHHSHPYSCYLDVGVAKIFWFLAIFRASNGQRWW